MTSYQSTVKFKGDELLDALRMRVYLEEIADASEFGMLMREQFLATVHSAEHRQLTMAWMALQSALLQYGMVSKFLFPIGKSNTSKSRGEILRTELGVPEDSLLKDREARNAFEHFDERLDRCLELPEAGIVQMVYKNRAQYEFLDPTRWILRRAYIVDEDILVSEGKTVGARYEMLLTPIFAALSEVHSKANSLLMSKYQML